MVNIKEERKLISPFIVASGMRQDIDSLSYFEEYELSVVPWPFFKGTVMYIEKCLLKCFEVILKILHSHVYHFTVI